MRLTRHFARNAEDYELVVARAHSKIAACA